MEMTFGQCLTLLNVNINSQVFVSKILMPRLRANKRSLIVNISSSTVLRPNPYLNLYSATKSFNLALSYSIGFANVDTIAVVPSSTKSQMNPGTYYFSISA